MTQISFETLSDAELAAISSVPPELIEETDEEGFSEALRLAGVPEELVPRALAHLDGPIRGMMIRNLATAIHAACWMLKGSRGIAMRRKLLGDAGESIRECVEKEGGKAKGVSKSALQRFSKKWDRGGPTV